MLKQYMIYKNQLNKQQQIQKGNQQKIKPNIKGINIILINKDILDMGNKISNKGSQVLHQNWVSAVEPSSSIFSHINLYRTRLLINTVTSDYIQQYNLHFNSEQELSHYKNQTHWRQKVQQLTPQAYFPTVREFINKSSSELCSQSYSASIYLDRIQMRLTEINDIPFADAMYMMRVCLEGFKMLMQRYGCFRVTQQQVFVTRDGEVKVWLNPNVSSVVPFKADPNDTKYIGNINNAKMLDSRTDAPTKVLNQMEMATNSHEKTIYTYTDQQNSRYVMKRISQQSMVLQILNIIENNIDQDFVYFAKNNNYIYNGQDNKCITQNINGWNNNVRMFSDYVRDQLGSQSAGDREVNSNKFSNNINTISNTNLRQRNMHPSPGKRNGSKNRGLTFVNILDLLKRYIQEYNIKISRRMQVILDIFRNFNIQPLQKVQSRCVNNRPPNNVKDQNIIRNNDNANLFLYPNKNNNQKGMYNALDNSIGERNNNSQNQYNRNDNGIKNFSINNLNQNKSVVIANNDIININNSFLHGNFDESAVQHIDINAFKQGITTSSRANQKQSRSTLKHKISKSRQNHIERSKDGDIYTKKNRSPNRSPKKSPNKSPNRHETSKGKIKLSKNISSRDKKSQHETYSSHQQQASRQVINLFKPAQHNMNRQKQLSNNYLNKNQDQFYHRSLKNNFITDNNANNNMGGMVNHTGNFHEVKSLNNSRTNNYNRRMTQTSDNSNYSNQNNNIPAYTNSQARNHSLYTLNLHNKGTGMNNIVMQTQSQNSSFSSTVNHTPTNVNINPGLVTNNANINIINYQSNKNNYSSNNLHILTTHLRSPSLEQFRQPAIPTTNQQFGLAPNHLSHVNSKNSSIDSSYNCNTNTQATIKGSPGNNTQNLISSGRPSINSHTNMIYGLNNNTIRLGNQQIINKYQSSLSTLFEEQYNSNGHRIRTNYQDKYIKFNYQGNPHKNHQREGQRIKVVHSTSHTHHTHISPSVSSNNIKYNKVTLASQSPAVTNDNPGKPTSVAATMNSNNRYISMSNTNTNTNLNSNNSSNLNVFKTNTNTITHNPSHNNNRVSHLNINNNQNTNQSNNNKNINIGPTNNTNNTANNANDKSNANGTSCGNVQGMSNGNSIKSKLQATVQSLTSSGGTNSHGAMKQKANQGPSKNPNQNININNYKYSGNNNNQPKKASGKNYAYNSQAQGRHIDKHKQKQTLYYASNQIYQLDSQIARDLSNINGEDTQDRRQGPINHVKAHQHLTITNTDGNIKICNKNK